MSVLPQVVTRNWRLKLSAFILSVFLWAIVSLQPRNREVIPTVPVQVVLHDPAWVLAETSPMTVSVHLGGVAQTPFGVASGRATVVEVPIDRVSGTDTVVRLRPEWVRLSGGANLVVQSITPATVALRFEPTASAAVPLSLRTLNSLPDGLALAQPLALTPQVATVRGTASAVERIDSLPLVPLDLRDVTRSGTYRLAIDPSGLEGVTFQPGAAQVAVNLQPSDERTVGGVPVVVEPPAGVDRASLVATPATVQVTLRGARTLLDQTTPAALAAVVDARDLTGIAAGNEWRVPIRLRGLSPLVQVRLEVDSVRVLREPPSPGDDSVGPDSAQAPARGGGPVPGDTLQAAPGGDPGPGDTLQALPDGGPVPGDTLQPAPGGPGDTVQTPPTGSGSADTVVPGAPRSEPGPPPPAPAALPPGSGAFR